ncbi:MAG: ATP-binding protein, partial [Saprospiraceae bacterium]
NKNWILFFDEADALFGKRTDVKDVHDRYANQEVSYLLQRVENYPGLVILSSNFKNNIDDAFVRRFNSIIHFPFPSTAERLQLWEKAFPEQITLALDIDLKKIADRYKLSGANIMNIVQHVCLGVLAKNSTTLSFTELVAGIRREFEKEGKVI